MERRYDIAIIGTGAGGGTLAYALRDSGLRVLLIERGGFLPKESENWNPEAVFIRNRYKAGETWLDGQGRPFKPGVHYFVGGNTKLFGAALPRFRREDFGELKHAGGISPAWPITYEELEPYYTRAEQIYRVHGTGGEDPTDPPRSAAYPFPPVPRDPYSEDLAQRLRAQGLHPSHLPIGVDLRPGGTCIRCKTCDAFPCLLDAKSDADLCCVRPALERENVELLTHTRAHRLITEPGGGRVVAVEVERDGERFEIHADTFIVSCGAANSAALLLRSANDAHPTGLANSSGLVGRNYMQHNGAFVVAVAPDRPNPTVFTKTLSVNDFYLSGPDFPYPLGNIQPVGKVQADMLAASLPLLPQGLLRKIADHSADWWVQGEDLPDPENRVTVEPDGRIRVIYKPNNQQSFKKLLSLTKQVLRRAGYRYVFSRTVDIATNSHQCGTLRFGHDPATSVLDPLCRTHDVANLYVVDGSFLPSAAAMNPALTIAAQALRVAEHLLGGEPERIRKGEHVLAN